MKAKRTNVRRRTKTQCTKISLPYIKGTSEKLTRILKKGDINVAFSPINIIKSIIDTTKDHINPKIYIGVYSIPCSYGKVYKTRRSIKIRLKQHLQIQNGIEPRSLHSQNTPKKPNTLYVQKMPGSLQKSIIMGKERQGKPQKLN